MHFASFLKAQNFRLNRTYTRYSDKQVGALFNIGQHKILIYFRSTPACIKERNPRFSRNWRDNKLHSDGRFPVARNTRVKRVKLQRVIKSCHAYSFQISRDANDTRAKCFIIFYATRIHFDSVLTPWYNFSLL